MGEASGHGPSEFSIVRDSIRRDREALFEGTRAVRARRTRTSAPSFLQLLKDRSTHHRPTRRDPARPSTHPRLTPSHSSQFIPSIEAGSDDDGSSSDGELPIFFTSADPPSSSTARHHADPAISIAASETTTATTAAAPIFRDEGDELAAFERAASEALAREEERSARIVAAHLDGHHDEDDEDEDAMPTVRARPRTARAAVGRRGGPPAGINTHADTHTTHTHTHAPTNVAEAMSSLFDGWLSGAAGRLANRHSNDHRTADASDAMTPGRDADHAPFDATGVEREFASRGVLDADGNLPETLRDGIAPRASVSLNLDVGGVDLDALLARLRTAEGQAELERERAAVNALKADDVDFGLVDDDDDDDGSDAHGPGLVPAAATAAARRAASYGRTVTTSSSSAGGGEVAAFTSGGSGASLPSGEGWAREHARGLGANRPIRPRSALTRGSSNTLNTSNTSNETSGGPRGAGAPQRNRPGPMTDPYGRGNARLRSARRPAGLSFTTTLGAPAGRGDADADADAGEAADLAAPLPFNGAFRSRIPEPTVRINAWETVEGNQTMMSARDEDVESDDSEVKDEMEEWRASRAAMSRPASAPARRRMITPNVTAASPPSSPAAAAADAASASAARAAADAKAAASRANAQADAREAADLAAAEAEAAAAAAAVHAERRARVRERVDAAVREREEAERRRAHERERAAREAEERAEREAAVEPIRVEGNAFFRRGEYAEAIDAYTRALELAPDDAGCLSNRAAARLKVGDAEAALEDASAALRSDPDHDKARRRRAQARVELGDLRGALGDLEALHSRLPLNAKVAADLADVRRSVAHADGETLAEMDRHDEERAAIAESREAAWEAKREAGLRAHRQRAMSARASRTAVKPR